MKTTLKDGLHYQLLAAWFTYCAQKDGRALEAVVRRLDSRMWSEARVVCAGVSVKDSDDRTPLLAACGAGRLEMCEALITARADVSAADKDGRTPLLAACEAPGALRLKMCEALIKAGADVNAKTQDDKTPLLAACGHGDVEMCEALIKARADVNAVDKNGFTPLLAACDLDKRPQLGADKRSRSFEICEALIKAGADDSAARCPNLHTHASHIRQSSLKRMLRAQTHAARILPYTSCLNARASTASKQDDTELQTACRVGNMESVRSLVQQFDDGAGAADIADGAGMEEQLAEAAVRAIPIAIREPIATHPNWGAMKWIERLQLLIEKQGLCGPSGCGDGVEGGDGTKRRS